MKNLTWLLLFVIFTYDILCNDSILSKFHQHSFKLKDVRVELPSYKEKYYNFFQLKTFKYNRTTPAVNATFNMKISVKDKLEVVVQVYKFLSNEYRRFPIRFQLNAKRSFDSNAIGFQGIKNCGNISDIYYEKDITYHACNFVFDETQFPPLIPSGRFRINFKLTYLNEEVALMYGFGEVYTPIAYPPK